MEYDFVLAPGSDLRPRFACNSVLAGAPPSMPPANLEVTDGSVTFRQLKPLAWQHRAGQRVELASSFRLQHDGSVGFDVRGYDPARELVIDPVLAFAGYISGDTEDRIYGVAAVSDGYWLVGATGSTFTIPSTITPSRPRATPIWTSSWPKSPSVPPAPRPGLLHLYRRLR